MEKVEGLLADPRTHFVVREAHRLAPDVVARIVAAQEALPDEPVDIFGLCGGLDGVRFWRKEDMPPRMSGAIVMNGEYDFDIFVNAREAEARQRFTAAHELAHYVLHKDALRRHPMFWENFLLRGGLSNRKEVEANQLAAEILMPYAALDAFIEAKEEVSLGALASQFGVSVAAMKIRLGMPLD